MSSRLEEYKAFVEGLLHIRPSVEAGWAREKSWPRVPENKKFNEFLSTLKLEQRAILADMLQQARDSGIHDTLAYLNDEIALNDLHIFRSEVELAAQPYGTELYYDWWSRCNGDPWPEDPLEEEYK